MLVKEILIEVKHCEEKGGTNVKVSITLTKFGKCINFLKQRFFGKELDFKIKFK